MMKAMHAITRLGGAGDYWEEPGSGAAIRALEEGSWRVVIPDFENLRV